MSVQRDIKEAVNVLQQCGTILYPTDTIWGIGCDATRVKAVEKVYRVKERVKEKSLIILVSDMDMLQRYVSHLPEIVIELLASVTDPLTIIYPEARNLPRNVTGDDGSIAIRIPKHDFCQELIGTFGKPITSTSANLSGAASPFSYSNVAEPIKEAVDHIVPAKYQNITNPKPSTIVKIGTDGELHIIRN